VLLDDLVETRIVQLDKLGQVVHVGDQVVEVLLQQNELLLGGAFLPRPALVQAVDDLLDLALAHGDAPRDLQGLELLLRVDFVELVLELADEPALVLLGPDVASVGGARADDKGARGVLEVGFEVGVVDVVPLVLAHNARAELLAELHGGRRGSLRQTERAG
jgi:hypothetical protein